MEAIKNRLQLNREQLKLIAIASMIIDHLAWGFVEFYSPLGQFLHVLGRLTIPIMCFFIAEGFRKTSNLRNYINRMLCFGILAVVPFYIFFHEEYGYRTNFIFDLLFGLLALSVTESTLKKWQKWVLMILIFGLSAGIGGWPITPTLFILIFYYGKSFKQNSSRLGGDEFSAFLYDEIQDSKLDELITGIMTGFQERLSQLGYTGYTSLSIGAVKCDIEKPNQTDFATIYNMTDKVLYEVKKRGKNQYLLRSMESLGRG